MRKIIIYLMVMFCGTVQAQQFSLHIQLDSNMRAYKLAVLSYQQGFDKNVLDTVAFTGRIAVFNGSVHEPVLGFLKLYSDTGNNKPWTAVFAFFNDTAQVTCFANRTVQVKGSTAQDDVMAFAKKERANEALRTTGDEVAVKTLAEQFIDDHPNSPYSLLLFKRYARGIRDYEILTTKFDKLALPLRQGLTATWVRKQKILLMQQDTGLVATDFSLPDNHGKTVRLSDMRGKFVLLEFWATYCTPCIKEVPFLTSLKQELAGKPFEIVSVSLDTKQSRPLWLEMIAEHNMKWVHLGDGKGFDNPVAAFYAISGIPQNYLIDPKGRIIAKNLRGKNMIEIVTGMVKGNAK